MSNLTIPTKEIEKIAQKYHLDLVVLFGSQATGQVNKMSDIDVAVMGKDVIDFSCLITITMDFYSVFQREDVDVVDMRKASPIFRYEIAQEGKVLYETDPLLFLEYKLYAFKRFVETKHLRNMRSEYINKRIQNI